MTISISKYEKKMKGHLLIIFLILAGSLLFSKKLASFPEINRPYSFVVDGKQFYISEKSTISIYTLKNFKIVKKFGRRGEGPGEFKSFPIVDRFQDDLVVNCFGKLLFFSDTGNFKKEIKISSIATFFVYPIGKCFVGLIPKIDNITRKKYKVIEIFDKNMKKIKEIASVDIKMIGEKGGKRKLEAIKDYFYHKVYNDNIYIANSRKGFFIEVFDSKGNKLYEINKEYERLKVSDKYKEDYLNSKKNPKDFIDRTIKSRYKYVFRDYFPAIRDFIVKDGKIYVFTYKQKDKKNEVVVMDLNGNILVKTFLTKTASRNRSISNGKYYFLKENDNTENWELFVEEIK